MATVKKPVKKAAAEKAPKAAKTPAKVAPKAAKEVKVATRASKKTETTTVKASKVDTLHATITVEKTSKGLETTVLGVDGKTNSTVTLSADLFDAAVNKPLMAQAVRIYLANQRQGTASVKTRGEVEGSTRKIFKQKGTGNARHGNIRAPIFVGGGIVFGPEPRDFSMKFPTTMKHAALRSALTVKLQAGEVMVVGGLEDLGAKTKPVAAVLSRIGGRVLLLTNSAEKDLQRASRNIAKVTVMPARNAHTYAVLHHGHVVMTTGAVKELQETFAN